MMMSIAEALRECRINKNMAVPIFELIKICDMPISDFKVEFWNLFEQLDTYQSSRMQFWEVSDEAWDFSDKYYAYSRGIKNKDRQNMIELFKGHENYSGIYYIDTHSLIKHNLRSKDMPRDAGPGEGTGADEVRHT